MCDDGISEGWNWSCLQWSERWLETEQNWKKEEIWEWITRNDDKERQTLGVMRSDFGEER